VRLASDINPDNAMYRGLLQAYLRSSGLVEEAEQERKAASRMDRYDLEVLAGIKRRLGLDA
jgi:hypothetical protein